MGNKIFSTLFLCCSFFLSAQQPKDIEIEYQKINNTEVNNAFYNTYNTTLWVDGQVSIFQEKTSTTRYSEKGDNDKAIVVRPKINFEPYIKIDRNKKEILFFEMMGGNIFLVKDNYNDLKWNITSETKKVAGYNCVKATTLFRGRTWIAWFAPDIPLPFGPWKLHGLPGIILEASELSNRYVYKAVNIKFLKSGLFSKSFNQLMNSYNTNAISYRQFLTDKEEYLDNAYKQISQEMNVTATRQKFPPNAEETKFEWEE